MARLLSQEDGDVGGVWDLRVWDGGLALLPTPPNPSSAPRAPLDLDNFESAKSRV